MDSTLTRSHTNTQVPVLMPRQGSRKTKTARVYEDLADLIDELAGAFGQSSAEFLDPILRPILEKKRAEGAARLKARSEALLAKKQPPKPDA